MQEDYLLLQSAETGDVFRKRCVKVFLPNINSVHFYLLNNKTSL